MSKPNFVTRARLAQAKALKEEEEKKEKARKFRAGLNEWWQNAALTSLTHIGYFDDQGNCYVQVGTELGNLYGIGEFAIAVNELVLGSGAPYTIAIDNPEAEVDYVIRFTCV